MKKFMKHKMDVRQSWVLRSAFVFVFFLPMVIFAESKQNGVSGPSLLDLFRSGGPISCGSLSTRNKVCTACVFSDYSHDSTHPGKTCTQWKSRETATTELDLNSEVSESEASEAESGDTEVR
jgi:hypothetical protein